MKKLLSLLLTFAILLSCASFSAFALYEEVTDDFLNAVRVYYDNDEIDKNRILILYLIELGEDKYITHFDAGYAHTDDMLSINVGDYIIESSRPAPVIYADKIMYDLEDAYEKGIVDDSDLDYLLTCDEIDIRKPKLTKELREVKFNSSPDDLVYVRFELVGSDKWIDDYENWIDDVSGTIEKLNAHYESLHQKLLAEVLKDYEYVDCAHNNGISVVGVKCGDLYKIASSDFIVEMDYISDIHKRFIETYSPAFDEYTYNEIYVENNNTDHSYVILNAYGNWCQEAEASFRLGDVVMHSDSMYGIFTYQYGIYDITEDKFYSAYDLKDIYQRYHMLEDNLIKYAGAYPVGDSDGDRLVTVLDATKIQRVCALIERPIYYDHFVSHLGEEGYISDVDGDGERTVLDATAIQKLVANPSYNNM